VSEDPIGFAAGDANLFRYVGNSWPNATDPTGLEIGDTSLRLEQERLTRERHSREFRDRVTRMRQSVEIINRLADRMRQLIEEDLAKQGCPSWETIREWFRMAVQIANLTGEYIRHRDAAEAQGAAYYGDGVTASDVTEYLAVPNLPQGMQSVDPGSPSRDEFNERIGREREQTDEFADNYSTVNSGVQLAALATGLAAIPREGGKWAAKRVIAWRLAAAGAGAAAGYGIGKGLDYACDLADADEVTRAWVGVGFDLAAAIVLRRRASKKLGDLPAC
jgi:hypothetical protein